MAKKIINKEKSFNKILEKWAGWSNATGFLHLKSFTEYLDKNYKPVKK